MADNVGIEQKKSEQILLEKVEAALTAAKSYASSVRNLVRGKVSLGNRLDVGLLNQEQRAAHGYAWVQTTVEAMTAIRDWAVALAGAELLGPAEAAVMRTIFVEYLGQMLGGIPMSQNEFARPADMDAQGPADWLAANEAVIYFCDPQAAKVARSDLAMALRERSYLSEPPGDDMVDQIRAQFRRFVDNEIIPFAHQWHLENALIPDEVIAQMSEMGTFGICIDPEYGGLGLSKTVMCVVTEELSRGFLGAGSLGTRSEIAGDLIASVGSPEQCAAWLPGIASGTILPVAVFTEPNNGSDLGGLGTRAVRDEAGWRITGNKTWITHAARGDLMTVLARTDPSVAGHEGLSMFLAPKPRQTADELFPVDGLDGGEIEVLGYRGMREYELAFSDFRVPADALLGGREGQGFKQLMRTFESARIQTAARAVGVAFRAYELTLRYACERVQFGQPLIMFPRVGDKIAMMYAETIAARELAYAAARAKDEGLRCDIQAGMAKLLGARVAWTNADVGLQVHGGNGYALEYEISRILCDARILNVFEGAAEIQAHVVARGMLS